MPKKNWKTPLSNPIELIDGNTLNTLEQAQSALARCCGTLQVPAVEYVEKLLMAAAESGTAEDRAQATAHMSRVLKFSRWI